MFQSPATHPGEAGLSRPPCRHVTGSAIVAIALTLAGPPMDAHAEPPTWPVETWTRTFDYTSASRAIEYRPLESASRPWRLCVCYPHLKDSYWMSVNYGMVHTAERLGVGMQLFTAGGYPNLERQKEQLRACVDRGADAIIVGTVSYEGLTPVLIDAAADIPVIAAVNDIADDGIAAKAGVPWTEMGATAGAYLADEHPAGTPPVDVAWFPGPRGAGWVQFVQSGFQREMARSSARIVATRWGDTGTEIQLLLLEEVLEAHPDIDYIVGSAPTAEAAVGLLRARGRLGEVGIVADYFTHGVFRGIKRGRILAAPTDFPVLQGRLAVDMAVRALEGRLRIRHAGPEVVTVTRQSVESVDIDQSLSPVTFTPTFTVDPAGPRDAQRER